MLLASAGCLPAEGGSELRTKRGVRIVPAIGVMTALLAWAGGTLPVAATAVAGGPAVTVTASSRNDVSRPLAGVHDRDGENDRDRDRPKEEKPPRRRVHADQGGGTQSATSGTSGAATLTMPATSASFDGIGNGMSGPNGTFTVTSAPPDTNAAVGPNHIVQVVNTSLAVFNKSGAALYGPVPINALWSGFGGLCQADNDGDPVALYDQLADRWLIAQFAVTNANGGSTPFLMCVAVSTSADPTGSYFRYSFPYSNFPDYPKFAVWPDGYYLTTNQFNAAGTTFLGPSAAVLDRTRMLAGQPATQQDFTSAISTTYGGLLPSNLDGQAAPPAGSPNYIVGLGASNSSLAGWRFHTDWTTPANSTLSGPQAISVQSYTQACGGGTCIPQPNTSQRLDSLADRLMYRLAYRNLQGVETLVANHSVVAGSSTGIRWYELNVAGGTFSVRQQGTYAPDGSYRWMGSIAMDHSGDIAVGYSLSSSAIRPSIDYTGRLVGDALGTLGQGEINALTGGGSQTGQNLSRWGDYSSMAIDPIDDCTFWYSTEYIPSDGAFNWKTRIASFKYPTCGAAPPTYADFTITASPSSGSAPQGGTSTYTVSTANSGSGTAQSVSLSASGLPAGASAAFNPATVTGGTASTLTITAASSTPAGTYPVTITGTGNTQTHTTSVSQTVTVPQPGALAVINGGFESGSLNGWTSGGVFAPSVTGAQVHSGSYAAQLGASAAPEPSGDSSLVQTVNVPATGTSSLSFWYWPSTTDTITYDWQEAQIRNPSGATLASVMKVCSNAHAWTQVNFDLTPYGGQSVELWFNVHGDGYGDLTYMYLDDVTVSNAPPVPADFSITAAPAGASAPQGGSATYTVSTAVTSGSAGTVTLTASGAPGGDSVSFNPASVTAGGSSTMTVRPGWNSTPGNPAYTITVTGTEGSTSHSTTVSQSVTASDFTISVNPASLSIPQGGTATVSVGTTARGAAETISLSASGLGSGTSATFSPATVIAGASSTLTLRAVTTAATGTSTVTVTGAGQNTTQSAVVNVTVTAASPYPYAIVNGGFEQGLTGWTSGGAPAPVATTSRHHSGSYSAKLGASSGPGTDSDSWVSQTVSVPTSGSHSVTFWNWSATADNINHDWQELQIRSGASTLATPWRQCSNSKSWKQVTVDLTPYDGLTITLWFNVHDDANNNLTYMYLDDVSVS